MSVGGHTCGSAQLDTLGQYVHGLIRRLATVFPGGWGPGLGPRSW